MSAQIASHRLFALEGQAARLADLADRGLRRWVLLLAPPCLAAALLLPLLAGEAPPAPPREPPRVAEWLPVPLPEPLPILEPLPEEEPAPTLESEPASEPEPQASPEPAPEAPAAAPAPEAASTAAVEPPPEVDARHQAREAVRRQHAQSFAALDGLREALPTRADAPLRRVDSIADAAPATRASALDASLREASSGEVQARLREAAPATALSDRRAREVAAPTELASAAPAQSRSRPARSADEVHQVFDRNQNAFYTLYHRALRDDPGLQGKITLRVTIAADGSVLDCEVLDSELGHPELERRVLLRVRGIDFGSRPESAPVTVDYPLYFMPA